MFHLVHLVESRFNITRRICPGRFFAEAGIWLTIASVLAAFDIKPVLDDGGHECIPQARFTSGFTTWVAANNAGYVIDWQQIQSTGRVSLQDYASKRKLCSSCSSRHSLTTSRLLFPRKIMCFRYLSSLVTVRRLQRYSRRVYNFCIGSLRILNLEDRWKLIAIESNFKAAVQITFGSLCVLLQTSQQSDS